MGEAFKNKSEVLSDNKTSVSPNTIDQSEAADAAMGKGINACDKFSCKIIMKEEPPYKAKTDAVLGKIGSDPELTAIFNRSLRTYILETKKFDIPGSEKLDATAVGNTDDPAANFNDTLAIIPAPDDRGGVLTRWNDILGAAERSNMEPAAAASFAKLKKVITEGIK